MDYKDKIIVYLDFLGFGDFIKYSAESKINPDKKIQSIEKLFDLVTYFFKENDVYPNNTKTVTTFSDLIVISYDFKDFSHLLIELLDIQYFILNCITRGFLIRGSINYGKLIHTDKVIFGPGLVEAYKNESQIAKFPRVIIDKTLKRDLEEFYNENIIDQHVNIANLIKVDFDGLFYIDYFRDTKELVDSYYQYINFLKNLSKILVEMVDNPTLTEKMIWIRSKFTYLVNRERNLRWECEEEDWTKSQLQSFIWFLESEYKEELFKNKL